jgi:hypothetical protein
MLCEGLHSKFRFREWVIVLPTLCIYFCRVQLAVRHIQREMILPLAPAVGLISPMVKPERWLSQPIKEQQLA